MGRVAHNTVKHALGDWDAIDAETAPESPRRTSPTALQRLFGDSKATQVLGVLMVLLVLMLVVRPVVRSVLSYHRTASLLEERRQEVGGLASRHGELIDQLTYYETDIFLAERAREYGLTRPGETSYVVRELTQSEQHNADAAAVGKVDGE